MSYYLIFTIALYIFSYAFYITCSHGLGHKAEYLQLRRFIPCAILAVLPMYLVNESLLSPQYLLSFLVGVSWITAYPLLYYLTYHKISSDFGFHLDTVFGLYIIGWLISLKLLVQAFNIFPAISYLYNGIYVAGTAFISGILLFTLQNLCKHRCSNYDL